MRDDDVIARLAADGAVRLDPERGPRTTPRWQAAMARAALRLQAVGAAWDLRLPIAAAAVELWPDLADDEIARRIEALLPIEAAELGGTAGDVTAGAGGR